MYKDSAGPLRGRRREPGRLPASERRDELRPPPLGVAVHFAGDAEPCVGAHVAVDEAPAEQAVPQHQQRAEIAVRRGGIVVDAVEPRIRALLSTCPTMPATVIAERIGWSHGMTVLSERVRELRPIFLPPDPASRTGYVAGEIAQHDFWFPDIELPVGFGQTRTGTQLPVLTMVCAYSRTLFARLVPTRHAEDLYCGWWQHLQQLGAVPRVLVWDGEGAVGQYGGGRNKLTAECHAFRGTLGAKVLILRPRDPEAKGIIERAHDYLETSFLPGRVFAGRVRSVGYGVSVGSSTPPGSLPSVQNSRDWLRPAQRFPVIVEIDPGELTSLRGIRVGGQADVMAFPTRGNPLNLLGRLFLRDAGFLDRAIGLDLLGVDQLFRSDARIFGFLVALRLLARDFGRLLGAADLDLA